MESGDYLLAGKTAEWDESSACLFIQLQDAAAQALRIQEDAAQTAYSIEIENSTGTTRFGIFATAVTADMIEISSIVTTANIIDIGASALTTGKGIDMSDLAAITTGKALHIDATGATQTDGILVHIDSASTALTSTGRLLLVDHTGTSGVSAVIAEILSAAADETTILQVKASAALAAGTALNISVAALTTGTGLKITDAIATTTGSLVAVTDNSADTGTRSIVKIVQDNASATGATALEVQADNASIAAIKISGACTIGIDFTALTSTDVLFNATAGTGCTAAPQTNAAIGFLNIKVGGTAQWIPYYNAT